MDPTVPNGHTITLNDLKHNSFSASGNANATQMATQINSHTSNTSVVANTTPTLHCYYTVMVPKYNPTSRWLHTI